MVIVAWLCASVCVDFRSHHGLVAGEIVCLASSAPIDISFHMSRAHVHLGIGLHVGQVAAAIDVAVDNDSCRLRLCRRRTVSQECCQHECECMYVPVHIPVLISVFICHNVVVLLILSIWH